MYHFFFLICISLVKIDKILHSELDHPNLMLKKIYCDFVLFSLSHSTISFEVWFERNIHWSMKSLVSLKLFPSSCALIKSVINLSIRIFMESSVLNASKLLIYLEVTQNHDYTYMLLLIENEFLALFSIWIMELILFFFFKYFCLYFLSLASILILMTKLIYYK